MSNKAELRKSILDATIIAFNKKGLKLTMDDLASSLSISKKTIYTVFENKDSLLLGMVDYVFDSIKESEQKIADDVSMTTLEKIYAILGVLPDGYKEIDLRQLYCLKEKYPHIYQQVEKRLETGWEQTILLLKKGMYEGVIRKIKIPIFKMMMEAALEQFFQRDILVSQNISYADALAEVVEILINGIVLDDEQKG